MPGRTIALYGDTGSGKTTQIGELAKDRYRRDGTRTRLVTSDPGGYESIAHLEDIGVMEVVPYTPDQDGWGWTMDQVDPKVYDPSIGFYAFDGGSSQSALLMAACKRLSAEGLDIGGRPAPKFVVNKGKDNERTLGSNVDSHYMTVQSHMRDVLWRSTWLTRMETNPDVLWTFLVRRGEHEDESSILGPELAGKALTGQVPTWFNYCFRLVTEPQFDSAPLHKLYLQEKLELSGSGMSFGNSRYPLGVGEALPEYIEPASLVEALNMVERAKEEAAQNARAELGL